MAVPNTATPVPAPVRRITWARSEARTTAFQILSIRSLNTASPTISLSESATLMSGTPQRPLSRTEPIPSLIPMVLLIHPSGWSGGYWTKGTIPSVGTFWVLIPPTSLAPNPRTRRRMETWPVAAIPKPSAPHSVIKCGTSRSTWKAPRPTWTTGRF